MQTLSLGDLTVIALFLLGLVYLAYITKYRNENKENYFLMGRQLTLPMFVATLVSTWYGGIFGVTQITFNHGIYNFFIQGVFWYITYLIFAFVMVPRLFKHRTALTLADIVQEYVGPKSAKLSAWFNILDVFPISYTLALGIFIESITPLNLLSSLLCGALFVATYTAWGGFRSVVYTDCLQFVVMFLGVFSLVCFSFWEFGSLSEMWQKLPDTHKVPTGQDSWHSFAVWGFIALATLIDPNFHQRCFAAKDLKTAKSGIIISTCFWIFFDLCTTTGALYARAYMPHLESSKAYIIYAMEILPSGFRGLFLAAVASTIMSTLDSYLFTASKITAHNLTRTSDRNLVKHHRIFVFSIALAAVFVSLQFSGDFKKIWKFFGSISRGCLLIPVLYILFAKTKIEDRDFFASLLLSACAAIFWEFFLQKALHSSVDTFYVSLGVNAIFLLYKHQKSRRATCL